MNKQLNLCKILKGHEGDTFYCSLVGQEVTLVFINDNLSISVEYINKEDESGDIAAHLVLYPNGANYKDGECVLFPSKDQRDWSKWIAEQKPKVPKTWSELVEQDKVKFQKAINIADKDISDYNAIEKSALALLKIHQLIEVGYGGNVTKEEWKNNKIKYTIRINKDEIFGIDYTLTGWMHSHIAFHTNEQAEEFLSKPENVQLLKDYFMI